jgi:hypothetical protein
MTEPSTEPSTASPQRRSPWRAIGITLAASLGLAITLCGGGMALDDRRLGPIAAILLYAGALSVLAFLLTLLIAIFQLVIDLFHGKSKPS